MIATQTSVCAQVAELLRERIEDGTSNSSQSSPCLKSGMSPSPPRTVEDRRGLSDDQRELLDGRIESAVDEAMA
jgi:hypothetical protein